MTEQPKKDEESNIFPFERWRFNISLNLDHCVPRASSQASCLWFYLKIAMTSLSAFKIKAVRSGWSPAATAASRPRIPCQHVCPATCSPLPNKLPSQSGCGTKSRWCQTAIMGIARHPLLSGSRLLCYSFWKWRSSGAKWNSPSIAALETACRLFGGPCWLESDGTGAENLL